METDFYIASHFIFVFMHAYLGYKIDLRLSESIFYFTHYMKKSLIRKNIKKKNHF